MDQYQDIWHLSLQTFDAFRPHYKMAMVAVIKATGVNKAWFTLYLARGCDPEPFTLAIYKHLNPYDSPELLQSRIDSLVAGGFMEEAPQPGQYHLTRDGHKAIQRIFHIAHREIGKIQILSFSEMRQLADLLEYVVASAMRVPEPLNKHGLLTSRWSDIGSTGPATTRIDQYITDLRRFYADCRMASWQGYGVSGIAWDTLVNLCEGKSSTPEAMVSAVERGFTAADYAQAFCELNEHGWVSFDSTTQTYVVTPQGRAIRAEAERVAKSLFYAPWQAALHDEEIAELHHLFNRVLDHLRQIAA